MLCYFPIDMGTIVYTSLLDLFLDEDDYSLKEMVQIAHERYGFDEIETEFKIELQLLIIRSGIKLLDNGRYHKESEFLTDFDLNMMLGFLEKAPKGYFEERPPGLRKFYEDFEKKYGGQKSTS